MMAKELAIIEELSSKSSDKVTWENTRKDWNRRMEETGSLMKLLSEVDPFSLQLEGELRICNCAYFFWQVELVVRRVAHGPAVLFPPLDVL
jgi:hypothetical protein